MLTACQNHSSLEEKYNKALTHKESKEYRESNIFLFDRLNKGPQTGNFLKNI